MGAGGERHDATAEKVIQVIRDLLNIAAVAMPDDLRAVDPRIIKAEALLARLEGFKKKAGDKPALQMRTKVSQSFFAACLTAPLASPTAFWVLPLAC